MSDKKKKHVGDSYQVTSYQVTRSLSKVRVE